MRPKFAALAVAVSVLVTGAGGGSAAASEPSAAPATSSAAIPTAAASSGATYVSVGAARVVNTYTGAYGNRRGALGRHATMSARIGGHAGVPSSNVSAVQVTISVRSPAARGALVAWQYGTSRPAVADLQFSRGQRVSNSAIVAVSASGRIDIYNNSAGATQVLVDVTGYYRPGPASGPGELHVVPKHRVTTTTIGKYATSTPTIGGHAGVPGSGITALALTLNVLNARNDGSLIAYRYGSDDPRTPNAQFAGGRSAAAFAIVESSSSGRISLTNFSPSPLTVAVDVVGYFTGPVTSRAGALHPLTPYRVRGTGAAKIGAGRTIAVRLGGQGGVPLAGARAALVSLSTLVPQNAGTLTLWRGGSRPPTTNLQFGAGDADTNLALVPVGSGGTVQLYNGSSAALRVVIDVRGYYLASTITAPAPSIGRYPVDAGDANAMNAHGCADGRARSSLDLLDLGAQSVTSPLSTVHPGVALARSAGPVRLTYPTLVTSLERYLDGVHSCGGGANVSVAVGTNNDGDFAAYPATKRGTDWFTQLVGPLRAYASAKHYTNLSVVAADDIEIDFASTLAQAQQWESAYFAHTTARLIMNGAASGCPITYGDRGTCTIGSGAHRYSWTQAQIYGLGHHGSQVQVLPQIYSADQAVQWANINAAGGGGLRFAGSLTSHGVDSSTYRYWQGWVQLILAQSSVVARPAISAAVDLVVD